MITENMTHYEIVYSLRRRLPGEEDYTEIGFGATGGSLTPEHCADDVSADIQNYNWETEAGMPDPVEIFRDTRRWRFVD